MVINKTRIRKTDFLDSLVKENQKFVIGISDIERFSKQIKKIGFNINSTEEAVLPAIVGPVTRFNAEGKYIKLKDLPMETFYTEREWCWEQWAGRGMTETVCKIVDVPRQRYQREFIEPSSVELAIKKIGENKLIVSPVLEYSEGNKELIKIVINIFLEVFHEAEFFLEDLTKLSKIPSKRINWQVLPPGEMPWEKYYERIKPIVDKMKPGKRPVVLNRLQTLYDQNPDFKACGFAGFNGYLVFGFNKLGLYVCENALYGNATYVFGEDWEEISKLTKAEVIRAGLQEKRLIHREGWEYALREILKEKATK